MKLERNPIGEIMKLKTKKKLMKKIKLKSTTKWEPTKKEFQALTDLFISALDDPDYKIIVTR